MNENVWPLILLGGGLLAFLLVVSFLSKNYSLNNFKNKTVGDGQHGTARWATPKEIHTTYHVVPFRPRRWRKGEDLPTVQGIILGSMGGRKRRAKRGVISQTTHKLLERLRRPTAGKKEKRKPKKKKTAISKIKNVMEDQRDVRALVDSDDIHCLMIGASGVGKTAFFLYPNLEYACACGMSYLALDTKGDLARNYGCIASKYYGYQVTVIDLRNPTRSDGFNFLTLMNHYMDIARKHPENLAARARAEKYAKILAKTIINPDGDRCTIRRECLLLRQCGRFADCHCASAGGVRPTQGWGAGKAAHRIRLQAGARSSGGTEVKRQEWLSAAHG